MAPKGYVDYGTMWVCVCCMMVHANGECGDSAPVGSEECRPRYNMYAGTEICEYHEHHHEAEPWSACLRSDGWDSAPTDDRDDCRTFTCGGCGTYVMSGDAYGFVLWKKESV